MLFRGVLACRCRLGTIAPTSKTACKHCFVHIDIAISLARQKQECAFRPCIGVGMNSVRCANAKSSRRRLVDCNDEDLAPSCTASVPKRRIAHRLTKHHDINDADSSCPTNTFRPLLVATTSPLTRHPHSLLPHLAPPALPAPAPSSISAHWPTTLTISQRSRRPQGRRNRHTPRSCRRRASSSS